MVTDLPNIQICWTPGRLGDPWGQWHGPVSLLVPPRGQSTPCPHHWRNTTHWTGPTCTRQADFYRGNGVPVISVFHVCDCMCICHFVCLLWCYQIIINYWWAKSLFSTNYFCTIHFHWLVTYFLLTHGWIFWLVTCKTWLDFDWPLIVYDWFWLVTCSVGRFFAIPLFSVPMRCN